MMEPTVTQNSALYYAHHKVSKQRAALFRRLGKRSRKRHLGLRVIGSGELLLWPRFGNH